MFVSFFDEADGEYIELSVSHYREVVKTSKGNPKIYCFKW